MEPFTVRLQLHTVLMINKELMHKMNRLERLRSQAEKVTTVLSATPKGGGNVNGKEQMTMIIDDPCAVCSDRGFIQCLNCDKSKFLSSLRTELLKKGIEVGFTIEPEHHGTPKKPNPVPMPKVRPHVNDPVNHPDHYKGDGGLECIDAIKAVVTGLAGIEAVCTGQIIKYIWRWKRKNGLEDLQKCRWYLERLIEEVKSHD